MAKTNQIIKTTDKDSIRVQKKTICIKLKIKKAYGMENSTLKMNSLKYTETKIALLIMETE